jgi:hypothetical protein
MVSARPLKKHAPNPETHADTVHTIGRDDFLKAVSKREIASKVGMMAPGQSDAERAGDRLAVLGKDADGHEGGQNGYENAFHRLIEGFRM